MMMTMRRLEALALEVRNAAGLKGDQLLLAGEIGRLLLGESGVVFVHRAAQFQHDRGRIQVAKGHRDINHAVAHALALWALIYFGSYAGTPSETEDAANILGSAICAPPQLVCKTYDKVGEAGVPLMAKAFAMSQITMNLRIGEASGRSRAAVTGGGRVVANDETWRTSTPSIAIASGRARLPGIRRAALRSEPRSVDFHGVALRVVV